MQFLIDGLVIGEGFVVGGAGIKLSLAHTELDVDSAAILPKAEGHPDGLGVVGLRHYIDVEVVETLGIDL